MSESSPPRKPAKGTGPRKKKQAPKVESAGSEPGQGEVLPPKSGPEKPRVVRRKGEGKPRAKKVKGGVTPAGDSAGDPVGSDADVQGNLFSREPVQKGPVLGDPDSVGDAPDAEHLDRVDDGVGAGPLPGVDEREEAKLPDAVVDVPEVPGREGGLVPAKPKPKRSSPGELLLQIEDAVRGLRSPLPNRVEKDHDSRAGAPLESGKDTLQGVPDALPGKPDLLDHGGRDIDLGVSDPLAEKAAGDVPGDQPVVAGVPKLPADVPVEVQELARPKEPEAALDRGEIREGRAPIADGQAKKGTGRDRALEMKVELGLPKGPKVPEEGPQTPLTATSVSRTGSREIHAHLLAVRAFERYWLRGAALGMDLIVLAGVPFLTATLVVFVILLFAGEPPRGIEGIFHLAQISFAVAFLLRDSSGLSPGKRFFGLRAIRRGGSPVGPVVSILRNLPLLIPGLNFVEAILAGRNVSGLRLGDRLARTIVLEE